MITYIIIVGIFLILMGITMYRVYLSCNKEVKPNEVLVVSDGSGRKFYRSGKVFVVPLIQQDQSISLEPFEFDCRIINLQNREGNLFDTGVSTKIRVGETDKDIEMSMERFMAKSRDQIKEFIEGIIKRNFTIYLQELDLKSLVEDTSSLFKKVGDSVGEDLKNMGIIVESFEVKSFQDTQGLLQKLKSQA